MRPIKVGDKRDVVVEISLDREGLEWLAGELPPGDSFTKMLYETLQSVDDELAVWERNTPGLHITVRERDA